jgi:hypothetical protein
MERSTLLVNVSKNTHKGQKVGCRVLPSRLGLTGNMSSLPATGSLLPHLDERQRQLTTRAAAQSLGHAGTKVIACAGTGGHGLKQVVELDSARPVGVHPPTRRRPAASDRAGPGAEGTPSLCWAMQSPRKATEADRPVTGSPPTRSPACSGGFILQANAKRHPASGRGRPGPPPLIGTTRTPAAAAPQQPVSAPPTDSARCPRGRRVRAIQNMSRCH